ncbi:hypothetical protein GP486_007048 [Trichoglossum hirsutum]|uniref:Uncharacterized protein n=1 Tax=Trichoglossum hirsutum TaxID=265104 RepID=A0A9P8IGF2_9PEZI|nr:hypothetical protein GP486_007048 [Trichoglossum hirsutum]
MAPRGKRRYSDLLTRKEKRIKHEHAEQLRLGLAAEGAELETKAARKAKYLRRRPTYALAYTPIYWGTQIPGNAASAGEAWPELKDGSLVTEKHKRISPYLRLSPPRADDRKHISMYEAIGISEDDLNRDRNERHIRETEKLTESYQRMGLDEKMEVVDENIGDLEHTWEMPQTEEDNPNPAYQSIGYGEAEVGYTVTGNGKHTQSEQRMEAEIRCMVIRGDNRTQNERHMRKTNTPAASDQSSRYPGSPGSPIDL